MYLHVMDFVGVFAFAVSGALRARREGMDLFAVLVVAAVTAIGGGTVRDVLLGEPVYWLSDVTYLYVIAAAAVCTLVYTRFRRPPRSALLVADAFGLAVFAVLGARAGLEAGFSPLIAVIMGAITGVVGGRRGLGRINRLRLGSVSADVLRSAAGPVLIVPAPDSA
jgi:uncharacterized membrane protein YeiH